MIYYIYYSIFMHKVNHVYKIIIIIFKDNHFIKKLIAKNLLLVLIFYLNEVFTYNGEGRKY